MDMIVWDGLEDGRDVTVVLLDVKSGRASVNARQRKIRDAVEAGRMRFEVFSFRPERAITAPEFADVPPGTEVTFEELEVELFEPEDDDSGWEKHLGGEVLYADDGPDA